MAGLGTAVTNVRFLTEIGPDSFTGYGRVYVSSTKFFDALKLLLAFSLSTNALTAYHAGRRHKASQRLNQSQEGCSAFCLGETLPKVVVADQL